MYKLEMNNQDNIELWAYPVVVDETIFSLGEGYNWIGYSPQESLDINTALYNVDEGSIEYIKNQEGYADFYNDFGDFVVFIGTVRTSVKFPTRNT